jgi:hypothetical protein
LVGPTPPGYDDQEDTAMTKKLYGVFVPLLVAVAIVGMPAAAQAAIPHWYKEGTRLPFKGEKTGIIMTGALSFTDSSGLVASCPVLGSGDVFNKLLAEPGFGDVEALQFYECSSELCSTVSFVLGKVPYTTKLTEVVAGTIRDSVKVTELVFSCSGSSQVFTGTLEPKVVNGTSKTAPSSLEFDRGSGELTGNGGVTATFEGKIRIEGEEQELITAKAP